MAKMRIFEKYGGGGSRHGGAGRITLASYFVLGGFILYLFRFEGGLVAVRVTCQQKFSSLNSQPNFLPPQKIRM